MTGLGVTNANIQVYIENIPPLAHYQTLKALVVMSAGEINTIAQQTGNHWRKIFNVYAKLCHQIDPGCATSWQQFRDNELLQAHSHQALLFSPPVLTNIEQQHITLIMGRTYAAKLGAAELCHWISPDFAINASKKLIICPYFDYRQLSNIKIEQLTGLIANLRK